MERDESIMPGALLVQTRRPELLETQVLRSAISRADFRVESVERLTEGLYLVHVTRTNGEADAAWTRAVISELERAEIDGIEGVRPNRVSRPF